MTELAYISAPPPTAPSQHPHRESADPPTPSTLIGGRYRIEGELARGGMGTVCRAHDLALDRPVALKRLHPKFACNEGHVLLFQREYHTLARLAHPRIVEVYDYGIDTDAGSSRSIAYYTMELLDTGDLAAAAPVPPQLACKYLRDVASALALIHAQRLIHRDLTARNVRLTPQGHAKLIDFGALSGFGVADQVVGTPPFIAPEALRNLPLDPRTDLYALGALAYRLVTGRHAYPARTLSELPVYWETTLQPPSHYQDDLPIDLDALVMALLDPQAVARPGSAGEVIERLNAIGQLEPDPELESSASYLTSSPFVGRHKELARLERRVRSLLERQRRSTAVLSGEPGMGKSRLLAELALRAQVAGATVLFARSPAPSRPYGLAEDLAKAALLAAPQQAGPILSGELPTLGHVMPDLHRQLDGPALASLPEDTAPRRQALQAATRSMLSELAATRPLLVIVDDLDTADEPSAAALAVLAQGDEVPWMLVASMAETVAPALQGAANALQQAGKPMALSPLTQEEMTQLTGALFGEAPHANRLGMRLHQASAGNPARYMHLAEHLVTQGVVKHAHGTWILPLQLPHHALPSVEASSVQQRLQGLDVQARQVADVISLLGRPVSAQLCAALLQSHCDDLAGALDALLRASVLTATEQGYALAAERLQPLLGESLDCEAKIAWHARIAEQLRRSAGEDAPPSQQLEIGWHRLHGGFELEGADQLATAGIRMLEDGLDFPRALTALQAALEVYERHDASPYLRANVMGHLAAGSFYSGSPALCYRYGPPALRMLLDLSGLSRAQRLSRLLPPKLAIIAGMGHAELSRRRHARRGEPTLPLRELVSRTLRVAAISLATAGTFVDSDHARTTVEAIRPLRLFGVNRAARLIYDWCYAQHLIMQGRWVEGKAGVDEFQARLKPPDAYPDLGDFARRALCGGSHYYQAIFGTATSHQKPEGLADAIMESDAALATLWRDQSGMFCHAMRGERHKAEAYRARVEQHALSGGSTWQVDYHVPQMMLIAALSTDDVLQARRSAEELAHIPNIAASTSVFREFARGLILLHHGELAEAKAVIEPVLPQPWTLPGWAIFHGGYLMTLNGLGQHAQAKAHAEAVIAELTDDDLGYPLHFASLLLELSMAEAGLGHFEQARAVLDKLSERHGTCCNPSFRGMLHRYHARLALATNDAETFRARLSEMRAAYAETDNPNLIRHARVLERQAIAQGLIEAVPSETHDHGMSSLQAELSQCADTRSRADAALRFLLDTSHASSGHLYVLQDGEVVHVASNGEPPPDTMTALLEERLQAFTTADDLDLATQTSAQTTDGAGFRTTCGEREYLVTMLVTPADRRMQPVGALVLEPEPQTQMPPLPTLLNVARSLLYADASRLQPGCLIRRVEA